jgi:hypothetical protein
MNQHTTHHSQSGAEEALELLRLMRSGELLVLSSFCGPWLLSGYYFNTRTQERVGEIISYIHLGSLLQLIPGLRYRRAFSLQGEVDPKTFVELPVLGDDDLPEGSRDYIYSQWHTHHRPPNR